MNEEFILGMIKCGLPESIEGLEKTLLIFFNEEDGDGLAGSRFYYSLVGTYKVATWLGSFDFEGDAAIGCAWVFEFHDTACGTVRIVVGATLGEDELEG